MDLLEEGAYFNVDTQRCHAYKRVALSRGNMILAYSRIGAALLLLNFSDITLLFIPYPAKICAF